MSTALERTYIHVNGVGRSTESRLWAAGAVTWRRFLDSPERWKMSAATKARTLDVVSRSPGALRAGDFSFFSSRVAQSEHWRAFDAFPGRLVYLDIETTGGRDLQDITLIGLWDGQRLQQFVRGENLLDFPDAMADVAVVVTFFGSGFDIPVLKQAFPAMRWDQLHIDLCHLYRRIGVKGGLKAIERLYGCSRSPQTAGLDGWDAVRLWYEWQRGSREAGEIFLRYNGEDVINLEPLAHRIHQRLLEDLRIPREFDE